MMKKIFFSIALALTLTVTASAEEFPLTKYVDLRIGSEGLGRVFIGPTCPFGMVKPSPDCTPAPNNGAREADKSMATSWYSRSARA